MHFAYYPCMTLVASVLLACIVEGKNVAYSIIFRNKVQDVIFGPYPFLNHGYDILPVG